MQRVVLEAFLALGKAESGATRAVRGIATQFGGHVVEEEADRHVQDAGEVEQPARADPVHAALILLDLLEGQAQGFAKLFLAHAKKRATQPHPRADMDIDRARAMLAFNPLHCLIVRHCHLRCCVSHECSPAAIAVNAAPPLAAVGCHSFFVNSFSNSQ